MATDTPAPDDSPRVALVTGASRGIGAATARRLAADGFRVVLASRGADALAEQADAIRAAGGDALVVPTDASDPSALDALVEATREWGGRLDALINNAGILPVATRAEKMTLEQWHETLALDLTAPWYLASRAYPLMHAGSVVVNVSSTAAFYPSVGLSAYNAAKSALLMVTRCLALEWARSGVRVVGIAPGKTETLLFQPIKRYDEKMGNAPNVLNRIGEPEEIANLIGYVVSPEAGFITGSILTIDGGELLTTSSELPH
jgi:NAD(P)-dependent dehydrogenase (short-subunit alcohol dehydrogenase family)